LPKAQTGKHCSVCAHLRGGSVSADRLSGYAKVGRAAKISIVQDPSEIELHFLLFEIIALFQ
jgi:hypothetical protein